MIVSAPSLSVSAPHVVAEDLGLERNGRWLFRGLHFQIPRGKFVAVVGPSGVGKSSLLACLSGLVTPQEGRVWYEGAAGDTCRRQPPAGVQKHIGIVFQNLMLVPNSPVLANVLLGRLGRYPWWRTLFGFSRADRLEAFRLIDDLGLAAYTHRCVGQTSGGEQQRTALARALFQEPDIYLADEPVSNLDAYLTGRVLGRLRQEAAQHQRTVFCVLHNADLVERFADWVLSLDPQAPGGWKLREVRA